jgi:hypothetical protein
MNAGLIENCRIDSRILAFIAAYVAKAVKFVDQSVRKAIFYLFYIAILRGQLRGGCDSK